MNFCLISNETEIIGDVVCNDDVRIDGMLAGEVKSERLA
jgi:cytoskeletal protein CcmA (bactofilin family)